MSTTELSLRQVDIRSLEEITSEHIEVIKTIRNACANDPTNSCHNFIKNGTVLYAFQLLRTVALEKLTKSVLTIANNQEFENEVVKSSSQLQQSEQFVTFLCQFIANLATTGEEGANFLFSDSIGQRYFEDAVAATAVVKSRRALGALVSALHQSLHPRMRERPPNESESRMAIFLSWRSLVCQILLSCADIRATATSSSSSSSSYSSSSSPAATSDPALEWLHFLVFLLLRIGFFLDWFLLVGSSTPDSTSGSNAFLSHEQVSVLLVLLY